MTIPCRFLCLISTVTCNIIKWKYSNKTEADEVQELLEIVSDTKDLPFKTTFSSDYYRQRITLQKNDEMVANILNDEFADFVVYPYRYNETYKMNRIMLPIFTFRNEIGKKTFIKSMPNYYDGIIAFVLDADYTKGNYIDAELPDRMLLVNKEPKSIILGTLPLKNKYIE